MRNLCILLVLFIIPVRVLAALDIYGGDASHPCAGTLPNGSAILGATGHFYIYKDSNLQHWMFCDPLGNRYWLVTTQDVNNGAFAQYQTVTNSKYPSVSGAANSWSSVQANRMISLGFNAVGEISSTHMWPTPAGDNIVSIPFLENADPGHYVFRDATTPVKEIFANLPPQWDVVDGYRGFVIPDFEDPAWSSFITNNVGGHVPTNVTSAWNVGIAEDDVDFIRMKGQLIWMIGVSAPYEQYEKSFGSGFSANVFADPTMHAKQAWSNWLCGTRYANVAALNAAWGSGYSTCGSSASTSGTETIGTGNGALTSFTTTLAHASVDPASVGISVGGVLQGGDAPWFNSHECAGSFGTGCIQAATGNINGGTVTYATGAITVTFSAAPSNGTAITATYQYNGWPKSLTGAVAPPAYVQNATCVVGSGTHACSAFGSNNTAGNTILVLVECVDAACPSVSASDTKGNTYNRVILNACTSNFSNVFDIAIIEADNIAAGANTVSLIDSSGRSAGQVLEYSGLASSALDKFSCANGSAAAVSSGSTATTTSNVELVLGYLINDTGAVAGGSGFLEKSRTNAYVFETSEDKEVVTTGAYAATGTSTNGDWAALVATFKAANQTVQTRTASGLLDEDGTSVWWPAGDPLSVTSFPDPPTTTITTDMDLFLNLFATQYFKPIHDLIKNANSSNVVFGPDAMQMVDSTNSTAQFRTQVMAAAAANIDAFNFTYEPYNPTNVATFTVFYNAYHVPGYVTIYNTSSPDSQFNAALCNPTDPSCFNTHNLMGVAYFNKLNIEFNQRGSDGLGYIVGTDRWQYTDNQSESSAFGVVSLNDNLYGYVPSNPSKTEDQSVAITDPYGNVTTPETRNYGNFVNAGVLCGNQIWLGIACNSPAAPAVAVGHLP